MKTINLKNLESCSTQEVFEYVKSHMLSQNKKSMAEDGETCALRGVGGLSCAAGCLISDEEYEEEMETETWTGLVESHLVPSAHKTLIRSLQILHDWCCVEEWKSNLEAIENALSFGESPEYIYARICEVTGVES